jgi:hypothetical protein
MATEDIPTQVGDVLILQTKQSYTICADIVQCGPSNATRREEKA